MSCLSKKPKILCVGLVCLDVISYCDRYPAEDSDMRCHEQRWSLGGNACNNVTVLQQLGADVRLYTAIPTADRVENMVIVNEATATRTIQHCRNVLHEPTADEFAEDIKKTEFDWIHFEGRNFDEVRRMIDVLVEGRRRNGIDRPKISVECEKIRPTPSLEQLVDGVDVLFVSKDFAGKHGYKNMRQAVVGFARQFKRPELTVICAWGEHGASARDGSGLVYSCPAHQPAIKELIVDTLGAGDTFIGACLHALSNGVSLQKTIEIGCYVAGVKCTQRGITGLGELVNDGVNQMM